MILDWKCVVGDDVTALNAKTVRISNLVAAECVRANLFTPSCAEAAGLYGRFSLLFALL